MAGRSQWAQLRLLLWKDYLIRRRKMITLIGVAWTVAVVLAVYIVRANIDNYDFPTCQFAARALPSAGMLTFLQSFLCGVNNECLPMEQYQPVPTYDDSKLTQLKQRFTPLLYNETVLDLAGLVPDSLQLLATLSDVVDVPDFVDISKNGLKVRDLFRDPNRVKRYLVTDVKLSDNVVDDVINATVKLQGIMKGRMDRCRPESIYNVLEIDNIDVLNELVEKLCALSNKDVNNALVNLIFEVNFSKYIRMAGTMYYKLTGDDRLSTLADTVTAVLRMTNLQSFVIPELLTLIRGYNPDFSYFNLTLIDKALDVFNPTFGSTQFYKTLREIAEVSSTALEFASKFAKKSNMTVKNSDLSKEEKRIDDHGLTNFINNFKSALSTFDKVLSETTLYGVFDILSKAMNFINRWLPKDTKQRVLFYATLLTKLIEGANQVVITNMNIESVAYNTSLRHPKAVEILVKLSPYVVGKGLDALSDAERTQLLVSKIATPGQLFCDVNKVQSFFRVSKEDADSIKLQLCNDAWKNYVTDLVRSFGIFAVKDNINNMASLFIQDTLGKDTTSQLYTIDHDFNVLKNFTKTVYFMEKIEKKELDWLRLLNVTEESEFMKVIRNKGQLGKQIMVTIHGSLAKEVVNQNVLLSYKIAPTLKDVTMLVSAINKQLQRVPINTVSDVKRIYPKILKTLLATALSESKTFKSLTTPSEDFLCFDVKTASTYLMLPPQGGEEVIDVMCRVADAINNGLRGDSFLGEAFKTLKINKHNAIEDVKWTKLINGLKELYSRLIKDYPYLFEFSTYNMDDKMQSEVNIMVNEAKEMWFGKGKMQRSLHLCINLLLRFLDILERPAFDMNSDGWLQLKYVLDAVVVPLDVTDQFISLVTAVSNNETVSVDLPANTAAAAKDILVNVPYLIVDGANVILKDDTNVDPIIEVLNAKSPWPCSDTSMSEILDLRDSSKTAFKAMEKMMCFRDLEQEWKDYFSQRNYSRMNSFNWKTNNYKNNTYRPHLFLKFGSTFNLITEHLGEMKNSLISNLEDVTDDERLTLVKAWKYAVGVFKRSDSNAVLRNLFKKLDTVLNSVNLTSDVQDLPLHVVWERFRNCSLNDEVMVCMDEGRGLAAGILKFISVAFGSITEDLMTYFTEINDPNTTLLQILGFTRKTVLFKMYDKIQDLMAVLLNSYFDYGFMNQVRRASEARVMDCEALVSSLVPPAFSPITANTLKSIQPYVCPSILHWISLPKGDNTLLDLVAKPQYYFYNLQSGDINSSYEAAFSKSVELADFMSDLTKNNKSVDDVISINNISQRLESAVDSVLNYKISDTDPSYLQFASMTKKNYAAMIYLTKIVNIVFKISTEFDNMKIEDKVGNLNDDEEIKSFNADLATVQKMFKRRPHELVAFHFDMITEAFWKYNNTDLVTALNDVCDRVTNNESMKILVDTNKRTKQQICAKRYQIMYGAIESILAEDLKSAKSSLLKLRDTLEIAHNNDFIAVLAEKESLIENIKNSIKYAYDLGLPIYLKYLQSNVHHYNVILSFLSGNDWWSELRNLYSGPFASNFIDFVEKGFEVAEDFIKNPDQVHLVRLLSDINLNDTEAFCQNNVTLSDYLPDVTTYLSDVKRQLCLEDNSELLKEIPPLVFASQGFNDKLKLSPNIDTSTLDADLSSAEAKLDLILNAAKTPLAPQWITDDKIKSLRKVALMLLTKESVTKMSFGLLSNLVDAGTLFLNGSHCTLCSELTKWLKQLNLQLFKKEEYDTLMCHIHERSVEDVYLTLQIDFHWDMAISELLSSRNYTKYELNKSMNEFLDHVKLHLLDDMTSNSSKVVECLARDVGRNPFGNVTLLIRVLASTSKMFRSQLPHLHTIPGITNLGYLQTLLGQVSPNLDVKVAIREVLKKDGVEHLERLKKENVMDLMVNLRTINKNRQAAIDSDEFCKDHDCQQINQMLYDSLNWTYIDEQLPSLQTAEFWRFEFISKILLNFESLLFHVSDVLEIASNADMEGLMAGKMEAMLDFVMQVLTDDSFDNVTGSISGILLDLEPILHNSTLEFDMRALETGLTTVRDFKNYLLKNEDLKLAVSQLFPEAARVQSALTSLGVNDTRFWLEAAPRVRAGSLDLKPILPTNQAHYRISSYVCNADSLSLIVHPSPLDTVTSDDVIAAILEQFCHLSDEQAKGIVPVLLETFNYSIVFEKVSQHLLTRLYSAASLSPSQGSAVVARYQEISSLVPLVQRSVGNLAEELANEPLFQGLANFTGVADLLGSGGFLSSAGSMLCGKPLVSAGNRFYKAIASAQDQTTGADADQIDLLPTDFCKSLYKDIVSIEGGKIVWSFVKPLVMGKILYSPDTPQVRRIINEANTSFAHMIRLSTMIHRFARSFPSVEKLAIHRAGLAALTSLMTSSMQGLGVDVDAMFEGIDDLKGIGSLLYKASDLLHCVNLDRFRGMTDEEHLTREAARLTQLNEFSAGIVFLNAELGGDGVPPNIEYKIRMDIENVPTTKRLKNFFWVPGPESSFLEDMRYFRGFVQIQDLIDHAAIKLAGASHRRKRAASTIVDEELKWDVYTQQVPYPCYKKDFFQTSLYESQALLVTFFFALLFTVCSVVRFVVHDRQTLNTMLMSIMGVDVSLIHLSWFVSSLVEVCVCAGAAAAVLCAGRVLPGTEPGIVFGLLLVFGFSVLCFCYMMSRMFESASLAAVCAGLAYLVTFMPFVLVLSLETALTSSLKYLLCLSMSSSLCYAFLFITRFEAMGIGCGWRELWISPLPDDNMSIATAGMMMIVDGIIYLLIATVIEKYNGIKALKSSITISTTTEKAGVNIVNVSKIYRKRSRKPKLALDGVSIELRQGQVTTLLGHNGAGKTTLLKILTGMLKPTSGDVTILTPSAAPPRVGVCPQHDVLFDHLTPREHIYMYAMINSGDSEEECKKHVESMVSVLSLGPVSDEPACRLSGGTRRRLCVGLAFVGAPALVTLDEPTAAVDPAARRDIWRLISKLKANKTVLMTTHHMDEAELLSDQIIIMHKGQVHTTGSPIEIKRTLGTGYKLTVSYPSAVDQPSILDGSPILDRSTIVHEERVKRLVKAVREVIKNATVVEVSGSDVEIMLPFFDADGINNNFLSACETLEHLQESLGFTQFAVDCSSLEQVFHNVCGRVDAAVDYEADISSKSNSSGSVKGDLSPLVPQEGPLAGTTWEQMQALLYARYLHYTRNRWLLFLLIVLPSIFVCTAMAFSTIRPPADNEIPLRLWDRLYNTTQFLVPHPSLESQFSQKDVDFARRVMDALVYGKRSSDWTPQDTPNCTCTDSRQHCNGSEIDARAELMVLPNTDILNDWLVATQEQYIEKRYGGFTSSISHNTTHLIAWYNNKGHHALPSYINAINTAAMQATTGREDARIKVYTHPMKISKEQLSKDTVYQHIADAGISCLLLLAYCLVSAGGSIYLIQSRVSQEKRLQTLCGVTPVLYWGTALLWDVIIIIINMMITAVILRSFGFPVFVYRDNLAAICLLILLYGYGCGSVVQLLQRALGEASSGNLLLFCGNTFAGLAPTALLLILDIISHSQSTDDARWMLHKAFMLLPQFALADGLLEIAKNTVQAQVLLRFGMDTYKSPLSTNLISLHYSMLFIVGTSLLLLNLVIEYGCFDWLVARCEPRAPRARAAPPAAGPPGPPAAGPPGPPAERRRVAAARAARALTLRTIGNINAGFVDTEKSDPRQTKRIAQAEDVLSCVDLCKVFNNIRGTRVAVDSLTLGIRPGECVALLGQNGAGKSTTFKMLTGEIRPSSGQILLNNEEVDARGLATGLISYCPQTNAIDPLLTVEETLKFYCKLRGITNQEEVIRRTVSSFDLSSQRRVRAGALSGGNQRKLCAAVAAMSRSRLLLLDEPTSGMDPVTRTLISRCVLSARACARAVLLCTHALRDAAAADRLALMRGGALADLRGRGDALLSGSYIVNVSVSDSSAVRRAVSAAGADIRSDTGTGFVFVMPAVRDVDGKTVRTKVSDIFRLMAELQTKYDIEDYTVNQGSLDEMFLSYTNQPDKDMDVEIEPLPSFSRRNSEDLQTVTAL